MRKKSRIKSYCIFFLVILVCLSIPLGISIKIKGFMLDLMAPLWTLPLKKEVKDDKTREIENYRNQVRELLLENRHLKAALKEHEIDHNRNGSLKEAFMARVLYRSPLFWSNFFIINVGRDSALTTGINKGSPVISGGSLIGVVDYVGKKMSRVKLITDETLQPSVRVARGKPQNDELISLINRLTIAIEDKNLIASLKTFSESLKKTSDPLFLAKGVLQGKSQALWRSASQELKGFGFNYDFSDDHGPARDLLTGKAEESDPSLALIKAGDLLITSGLDGVFPEGIPVAYVKSVDSLKEGDFCFGIRAIPCVDSINNLTDVFVLPSLSIHEENFVHIR